MEGLSLKRLGITFPHQNSLPQRPNYNNSPQDSTILYSGGGYALVGVPGVMVIVRGRGLRISEIRV